MGSEKLDESIDSFIAGYNDIVEDEASQAGMQRCDVLVDGRRDDSGQVLLRPGIEGVLLNERKIVKNSVKSSRIIANPSKMPEPFDPRDGK